jgi:hypothetical protein
MGSDGGRTVLQVGVSTLVDGQGSGSDVCGEATHGFDAPCSTPVEVSPHDGVPGLR